MLYIDYASIKKRINEILKDGTDEPICRAAMDTET